MSRDPDRPVVGPFPLPPRRAVRDPRFQPRQVAPTLPAGGPLPLSFSGLAVQPFPRSRLAFRAPLTGTPRR